MAYANGKIYALRTHKGDEVYVGSTTTSLEERFKSHKCKSNKITSKSLFEKYDDMYIELIELFPCKNRSELCRREGEVMLGFGDKAVNKRIAGRTDKEYSAKYRANNIEKLKEKNKECCAKYYANNIEKCKENQAKYYEDNRKKCKEIQAKYQAENRVKINAKRREYYAKKKAETV